MNKASFTVEIDAKPNTQEYSDKMFSAMAECMKEITKDLYDSDKRITEYLVKRTNGDGFKVVEVEHISPRYMTISTIKYCKTREQAEKYRNAIVSNSKGSPSENSFNKDLTENQR
jgi:hypothetical protein